MTEILARISAASGVELIDDQNKVHFRRWMRHIWLAAYFHARRRCPDQIRQNLAHWLAMYIFLL